MSAGTIPLSLVKSCLAADGAAAAATEHMLQLMSHGDAIIMGAHSGELERVITMRVLSDGTLAVRWCGFQDAAQVLGTLLLGTEQAKAVIYGNSK